MKKHLLLLLAGFLVCSSALAQRTVSGTVTDEAGEPLIGANIVVKQTSAGTVADVQGKYTLTVPEGGEILLVSYTGYSNKEVQIGDQSTIDVQMSIDKLLLDEVVVTAYGSQRKREITGSVSNLKSEDVERIQTSNVIQGLSGKIPGVQIINQSGQPGDAPTVRFRGIGSVNASNSPLYVVDGVPYGGNINAIAPQDIE
jgi:outer membrane receptor for Fe3+-dicitrate